jgi:hypothetical protein
MKKIPNKINNLNKIKNVVNIPKYFYFNYEKYSKKKKIILKLISIKFKSKIIVRSACFFEDDKNSNAGKYLTVSDIDSKNIKELDHAINTVFNSYNQKKNNEFVLIQEYIKNAESVGVIFTGDPRNGSPFRTINFNNSNSTNLITSGKSNGKIICYFKNTLKKKLYIKVNKIEKIIQKVEKKFPDIFLDIEFLIYKKEIFILQVRKLRASINKKINFKKTLHDLEKKISKLTNEKSDLLGKERFFSTMTDWNPAEIIGLKPMPLALSLYQSLITDEVWAESRYNLGYKNIKETPLLYSLLGTPYIDLKTDINSFLIPELSKKVQSKLLRFYFNKFKKKPYYYYDKIESSLVINSVSLDIKKYKKLLYNSQLKEKELLEIIQKYKTLTLKIILKLNENIKKYEYGKKLFQDLKKSKNSTINKIYLLHNTCKNYGTLPFANLARMAFVAIEFLDSFESLKIITKEEKKEFLRTIKSVSFDIKKDLLKSKSIFFKKYGHLRPNTYEISTLNYKDNFNNYFNKVKPIITNAKKFKFSATQKNKINKLLKKNKFNKINANILINFIENSIYHREKSKLFFTQIINEIFYQLKILSKRIRLNLKDIKYLSIKKILDLYENFSHDNLIKDLKKNISENKKNYNFNLNFHLPNIILNKNTIYFFEEENASPTFITNKSILSKFITIKELSKKLNLDNKIVCIKNADPGYDFIFNYKIKGLITAFGGPNSHMSIRCNEFEVPAAIGIGEKKFYQLIENNTLYLNCEKKILSGL